MKKINKTLSCIIAIAILAISVFVPVTVSAAEYVIPDGAKFITDVEIGRILVGIEPGTTLSQLKDVFSDYTLTAKNLNNAAMADTDNLGTGCVVSVNSDGSIVDQFTVVVYNSRYNAYPISTSYIAKDYNGFVCKCNRQNTFIR